MTRTKSYLEDIEAKVLASYAVFSGESQGRRYEEKNDDERLDFQRDKDRIIHSRAFRRLEEKTQVFIAGSGDHYRTRLTHTLEVAQIAKDIARRLGLNEDLSEAIALAHDLGHPPFGHGGEDALNEIMKRYGSSFEHNEQSRRIVEKLEKVYPNFEGLNLSFEVLDGLLKHQTVWDQSGKKFETFPHLEAQVVNIADEIAYTNHDIDDGIRGGVFSLDDLRKIKIWDFAEKSVREKYKIEMEEKVLTSRTVSLIISMMIADFCNQTEKNIQKNGIMTVADVFVFRGKLGSFSDEMSQMASELRGFLYENFYMNKEVISFVERGKEMITSLFEFYLKNPDKFRGGAEKCGGAEKRGVAEKCGGAEKRGGAEKCGGAEKFPIKIKDYIAGMTDGFLQKEFECHCKFC